MTGAASFSTLAVAFVLLTLGLGGSAAFVSGRALARAWRSFAFAPIAMIGLAGAVGFLHYALAGLSVIPLYAIGAALKALPHAPLIAADRLARDLAWWAGSAAVLTGFAYASFRAARAAQMERNYGWLFERRRIFFWRRRAS